MYAWLWRHLFGPAWFKTIQCAILLIAVIGVLFFWVYPWIADTFPQFDNTVG